VEPECYPNSIAPQSSRLFLDYSESSAPLAPFFAYPAAGHEWMTQRPLLSAEHRTRLAGLLLQQNQSFSGGERTAANIARLRAGASAVVTGQQVSLFGGPLYTLLKAATAIARAQAATDAGHDTVPIFWLATEDHDYAEVAHVDLPAPDAPGGLTRISIGPAPALPLPVGNLPLGPSADEALRQAEPLLAGSDLFSLLQSTYRPAATLAHAFGSLIAQLFAPWGLIVLDASGRDFHALGAPVLAQAIRDADQLHAALLQRSQELQARGYHAQVLVTEQSSLLFLLDHGTGARLPLRRIADQGQCQWKAGSHRFSTEELLAILQGSPERISPNALLRPVFQDAILPTSAYIGGPAEIAYFAQSAVLYQQLLGRLTPVLPRLSASLVEPAVARLMARHQLTLADAFLPADTLAQRLGARALPVEGKRLLAAAGSQLHAELTAVTHWMAAVDEGLGRSAATAASKMRYQMNRLRRIAARHQLERETSLAKHARLLTQSLYPAGHLQERRVSGAWFLARYRSGLLDSLVTAAADPCPGHKLLPL
jgi:bacillithiol biosynthesis cysteine-adding enzyme BshC